MIKNKIKMVSVFLGVLFVFYGIAFAAVDRSATISWRANPDAGLYGYKVYIGTKSRKYTDYAFVEKTKISHRFGKLALGRKYYFCVTAVNKAGVESAYSQEVTKQMSRVQGR